ncbi:MAG: shikimate kinase [Clostridia bacterium]|nr:shikimate kinase [Clostridia bacterium]
MIDRHIFLIGMAGSGKSSLGKKLASRLRLPYIDTDNRITQALNMQVTEIFATYGEEAFRTAETNTLINLMDEPPAVVSTGGGAVLNPINYEIMRNQGILVLIDRPLEQIMSDIKLDRRPLLAAKGIDEVPRMYNARIDRYRKAADLTLDNSFGYISGVNSLERLVRRYFGE